MGSRRNSQVKGRKKGFTGATVYGSASSYNGTKKPAKKPAQPKRKGSKNCVKADENVEQGEILGRNAGLLTRERCDSESEDSTENSVLDTFISLTLDSSFNCEDDEEAVQAEYETACCSNVAAGILKVLEEPEMLSHREEKEHEEEKEEKDQLDAGKNLLLRDEDCWCNEINSSLSKQARSKTVHSNDLSLIQIIGLGIKLKELYQS